jgi:hypothetical protein
MQHRVTALAATATHHHLDPRMAATVVNGPAARKTQKTAIFPDDEMGRTSATDGTRAAIQKKARHMTPIHPTTVPRRLTLFMAQLYAYVASTI